VADIGELVIQIRATAEGLQATVEHASRLVRAFAQEAAGDMDRLAKAWQQADGNIQKAGGLLAQVKAAQKAMDAYQGMDQKLRGSAGEIAKVNRELEQLGLAFDGTEGSLTLAEKGLERFRQSLIAQVQAIGSMIFALEGEFGGLQASAQVRGVLTADASDMLAKIALSRQALQELLGEMKAAGLLTGSGRSGGGGGGGGSRKSTSAAPAMPSVSREDPIRKEYERIAHLRHMNRISLEEEMELLEKLRKRYKFNAEQIREYEEKIYDLRQEMLERDAANLDKMGQGVIDALTARYEAMQEAEIQRLDTSRKAWEDWRDGSVKAIEDQIAALEELGKTEDREQKDQEELRKIAKLCQDVEFEQDDYNRLKLQQQLDQAIAARETRLRKLSLEDRKAALREEITAIQDKAGQGLSALDEEQKAIEKAYEERMKSAALRAEAEKLIMTGTQQEIISLIGEFAPDYDALGKTLGEKLVEGFQSKVGAVVDWFRQLNNSLYAIQEQAAAQAVAAAEAFAAGYRSERSGSTASGGSGGTAVVNQTLNINQPVETPSEIARRLRQANEALAEAILAGQ